MLFGNFHRDETENPQSFPGRKGMEGSTECQGFFVWEALLNTCCMIYFQMSQQNVLSLNAYCISLASKPFFRICFEYFRPPNQKVPQHVPKYDKLCPSKII